MNAKQATKPVNLVEEDGMPSDPATEKVVPYVPPPPYIPPLPFL